MICDIVMCDSYKCYVSCNVNNRLEPNVPV